jgi:F0F1-type ATP synthase assembly protein I
MTKTKAPQSTLSPKGGSSQNPTPIGNERTPQTAFMIATLNMSWQMLIVVLLPIYAGHRIDGKVGSTPIFTILGVLVGFTAALLIVWRQLRALGTSPKFSSKERT